MSSQTHENSGTRRRRRQRLPTTRSTNQTPNRKSSIHLQSHHRSSLHRALLAILSSFGVLCLVCILWLLVAAIRNEQSASGHSWLRRPATALLRDNRTTRITNSLIHIVHTRFMQEQGQLKFLGQARLELFRSICLPTMIQQSTSDFLWIIKTDPQLESSIRNDLVELLRPYRHFFLVGSLTNYQAGEAEGSWRDGQEGRELLHELSRDLIYTGDRGLVQRAYDMRLDVPVLETRLDADDGLQQTWMATVQREALSEFHPRQPSSIPKQWMYWCVQRHLEWYSTSTDAIAATPSAEDASWSGILNLVQHAKLCVTPGLTVGYNVGTSHVPKYPHDTLYKSVMRHGGCSVSDEVNCIQMLQNPTIGAVRSRTPTSAGMMDALWNTTAHQLPSHQNDLWRVLNETFGISKESSMETGQYIKRNLPDIAKDNLEGQCTKGHSCKQSSVKLLKRLIENKVV